MKAFSALLAVLLFAGTANAQQTLGLFSRTSASEDGYVLLAPQPSTTTYLIDKCGRKVHSWSSVYQPGLSAYLQPDGTLLRTGNLQSPHFRPGGVIERIDWNSNVTWSYRISDSMESQHHDICLLPNGNILAIVWVKKSVNEALDAGRNPAQLGASVWSEKVVELQPAGTNSATIVWEWHVWDHLVQDYSSTRANFGVVADHPELINLNYYTGNPTNPDWLHINGIAYNPALDQVMLSIHGFSELWVIDHSTTTAQAASHSGGARGKGGDLLYRWGNPAAYGRGTAADQKLFYQHNTHWIGAGLPNAGSILIFNNGLGRPGGNYSTADRITPPVDAAGNYTIAPGQPFGPVAADWQYKAPNPPDFYASKVGGVQQLANGNTLICNGPTGEFFETDPNKNIVWRYVSPVDLAGPMQQGAAVGLNTVFRCPQYPVSYSGFAGRSLTPGAPIEINPLAYSCTMATSVGDVVPSGPGIAAVNPFGSAIALRSAAAIPDAVMTLTDALGHICGRWRQPLAAGAATTLKPPSALPAGIYFLQVTGGAESRVLKLHCTGE